MVQQTNPSSELQGKQLGVALEAKSVILVKSNYAGCDLGDHWFSEEVRIHSVYASPEDADHAAKELPEVEDESGATLTYRVVAILHDVLWGRIG